MPITKRIDRNLIILAAEALSSRLRFPEIGLKEERAGRRSGPMTMVRFKKEKGRPTFAEAFLNKSLQSSAAQLFNATKTSVKELYLEKDKFKRALDTQLNELDVLDENGQPLERLKLIHQLRYYTNMKIKGNL